jgi:hypothetical protein
VYAREVAGRTLTFGVSGMLYRDALVMFDRETRTLWSQVDGRAIRGPLAGFRLTALPSVHATWAEWLALYPQSLLLAKPGVFRTPYETYNRNPGQLGILGRRNLDKRLPGKERVLGITADGEAVAFPLARVRQARLVHAEVGSLPVVLAAPGPGLPVVVFDRRVRGRTLTFRLDEAARTLRDVETGSTWRLSDGVATSGPLAGAALSRAVAYPAFWFGWRGFFPQTQVWGVDRP